MAPNCIGVRRCTTVSKIFFGCLQFNL
jgi:hypothetical protein